MDFPKGKLGDVGKWLTSSGVEVGIVQLLRTGGGGLSLAGTGAIAVDKVVNKARLWMRS